MITQIQLSVKILKSYSDGYDYVSNNSSNWWNNGGTGGGGIIVSSPGAGYNSDGYIKSGDGWNRLEYKFSPLRDRPIKSILREC